MLTTADGWWRALLVDIRMMNCSTTWNSLFLYFMNFQSCKGILVSLEKAASQYRRVLFGEMLSADSRAISRQSLFQNLKVQKNNSCQKHRQSRKKCLWTIENVFVRLWGHWASLAVAYQRRHHHTIIYQQLQHIGDEKCNFGHIRTSNFSRTINLWLSFMEWRWKIVC